MGHLLRATTLIAVLLACGQVWAQPRDPRNVDGNRWRPGMDLESIIETNVASTPGQFHWDVSLWYDYGRRPFNIGTSTDERALGPLLNRSDLTLTASMAFLDWLQFGVDYSATVFQDRGTGAQTFFGNDIKAQGVGDLGTTLKLRFLDERKHGISMAAIGRFTFPTATPSRNYMGERDIVPEPELAVSRDFGFMRFAVNVGARFRSEIQPQGLEELTINDEAFLRAGVAVPLLGDFLEVQGEISGFKTLDGLFKEGNSGGLELLAAGRIRLADLIALYGGIGTGLARGYLIPDYRFFVGIRFAPRHYDEDGDGFEDDEDACPSKPEDKDGFEDEDGCPEEDNDKDGVLDADDAAPNEPEDIDEFEDTDGKPDPDNDGDGILDGDDKCPLEAEVTNGFEDEDGCPDEVPDTDGDGFSDLQDKCKDDAEDKDGFEDDDGCPDLDNDKDSLNDDIDRCPNEAGPVENAGCPDSDRDGDGVVDRLDNCPDEPGTQELRGCKKKQLVQITAEKIEILEKVFFSTGRAKIQSRSFGLLDNVAQVLQGRPDLKIEIQGHTDSRGNNARNKKLSQDRADAVMKYLVGKGVAADRLTAVGYGEEKPIDSNRSNRGRANNRRVEFVIVNDSGKGAP